MNVLLNWLSFYFHSRAAAGRSAARARPLAFEPLNRRLLLASDVVPLYGAEFAQIGPENVDDAMVGGAEDVSKPRAEAGVVVSVVVDGLEVGPGRIEGGKESGLDTIESAAASYGGYGGESPELSDLDVQWGSDTYTVSGTITDNDVSDATIAIDGVTVAANVAPDGTFTVDIDGPFYEFVDVIAQDNEGNQDVVNFEVD